MEVTERVANLRQELFGDSLSADEVSQVLGLDRATILSYLRGGKVEGYQVGREWRVTEEKLHSFVNTLKQKKRIHARSLTAPACTKCGQPMKIVRDEWGESRRYHQDYECCTEGCPQNWRTAL